MQVREDAPFLKGKDLIIIADCVAVAYRDLHNMEYLGEFLYFCRI